MVEEHPGDGPDLRNIYSFGVGSDTPDLGYSEGDPEYVAKFATDTQALEYAKKEGFDSVSRLIMVLHYPVKKEQGEQIVENLNKYNKPANKLFDELNQSLNPQQREIMYKLICHIFDKII